MATIIGEMKPHVDDILEFCSKMDMTIHNKQFYPTFIMILTIPSMKNDIPLYFHFKIIPYDLFSSKIIGLISTLGWCE